MDNREIGVCSIRTWHGTGNSLGLGLGYLACMLILPVEHCGLI